VESATRTASPFLRHWLTLFVAVAVAYALGSQLAFSWFGANGLNASFFPAAGVTMAALVLIPRRRWPVVLAAAGLAELTVDLWHDIELGPTLGYVVANLTQPVVGALLLGALVVRVDLGRTRELAAFIVCCVIVAPAVGGALGASTFVFVDGGEGWARFAGEWLVGDGLGVLVVASAILSLRTESPRLGTLRAASAVVLGVSAVLSTAIVFERESFAFVYLPIVLLAILAFRAGTRGVAFTGAAMAFVAAESTAEGSRYWDVLGVSTDTGLLYLQLAIALVVSTALALAAEITQRERTARALARTESEKAAVLERLALFDAERAARERAELLERHAGHLAAAVTPEDVARATVADLEAAGVPSTDVEVRREHDVISVLAATGVNAESRVDRDYPLAADTPGAEAIRSGRAVDLPTGDAYDARFPTSARLRREHGIESVYGVPLRAAHDRVAGAVIAAAHEPEWFDDARKSLVTAIAEQTGLALERAWLLDREREARVRAEADERLASELQHVTVALAAAETAHDVAHVVVTQLIGTLGGMGGSLFVVDEEAGLLRLVEHASYPAEVIAAYREISLDSALPPSDALRAREPVLLGSIDDFRELYPDVVTEVGLGEPAYGGAWAHLPLVAGARAVGMLIMAYAGPQPFDARQRGVLMSIGDAVAQALRRAELYEAERDARRRAELLERNASHLARANTVSEVAQSTIDDLSRAGIPVAILGVLEDGFVRMAADSGVPEHTRARDPRVPLDASTAITEVVRTGSTIAIQSAAEYRERFPDGADVRDETLVESVVAAPLRGSAGRILGGLVVGAREPAWFDRDRTQLVVAMADQCGSAIERALLHEAELEARRRADEHAATLAVLNEASERIASALTEREVAEILVADATGAFASERGAVFLLGDDGSELQLAAATGYSEEVAAKWASFPLDLPAAGPECVRTGRPVWIESPEEHAERYPDFADEYRRLGIRAAAFVPLLDERSPRGVLWLHFDRARALSGSEKELLVALGRQGALALQRATSFEREQQARRRAQLLERHAARLAAAVTVGEVAETTIADLEALGASAAWVQLVSGDWIELVAHSGLPAANVEHYARYRLDQQTPPAEAARTGRVVVVPTGAEIDERYPAAVDGRTLLAYESMVALPLRAASNRTIGVLTFTALERDWLDESRRLLAIGLAEQCGLALERAQLQVVADWAAEDAALLAELGEVLERVTGVDERARALVRTLSLRRSALAVVHSLDEHGRLEVRARAGEGSVPGFDELALDRLAAAALAADGPTLDEASDVRLLAVPLRARDRALGVLTMGTRHDEGHNVTTILVQRVATRAALALDNALLYEQERDVSHQLQLGLLGGELASGQNTNVATAYRPGTATLEVGGDWYDSFTLPDGRLAFLVGDVVGHGLEAAVAMAQLRGAVRALAPLGSPAQILDRLDDFVDTLPEAGMATLAYAELDVASGELVYACAGHPPPVLISAESAPRLLWDGRSAPLGSSFEDERREASERLAPGDAIVLYTDGLVERRGEGISERLDVLVECLEGGAEHEPSDLVTGILEACLADGAQEDDVCVLVVRRVAATAPFEHSFLAAPGEVAGMRRAFTRWLEGVDLDADRRRDAVLAVSEAAANAAEHAYGFDGRGIVRVAADVVDGRLRVLVVDEGAWREPRLETDRGRGRTMMRALMETVAIESGEHGTVVTMTTPIRQRVVAR
jgi:serine/threonine-protein kinase RsbW